MIRTSIRDMGRYSVCRTEQAVAISTSWVDDLRLGWYEVEGVAQVQAVFDFSGAEVRLVLRRGAAERVLASELERAYARSLVMPLAYGDEIALQWRVAPGELVGLSEVAELSLRDQPLCQ